MNTSSLEIKLYGMSKETALAQNICLRCQKTPTFSTPEGAKEYPISGLCEPCFDAICGPEEETIVEESVTEFIHKPEFDTRYDFENICSKRAFIDAQTLNCEVVLPEDNQLQIDIDSEEDFLLYLKNIERFDQHVARIVKEEIKPSRSGGDRKHITLTLDGSIVLEPDQRILYQLMLGSDRTREFLSYIRVLNEDENPTLFIEKPVLLLGDGNELTKRLYVQQLRS